MKHLDSSPSIEYSMFQALIVKRVQSKIHWARVALQKAYFAGWLYKTSASASSFHSCSLFDDVPSEAFEHPF